MISGFHGILHLLITKTSMSKILSKLFIKIRGHKQRSSTELYNIKEDRSEMYDLAGKYPNKVKIDGGCMEKRADRVSVLKNSPKE